MRVVARCLAAITLLTAAFTAAPGVVAGAAAAGNSVTITDGGAPGWVRFDDTGNGIDAHDGEIKQFSYVNHLNGATVVKVNGATKYYLYGTSYGCGYVRLHGYFHDAHPVTPFCGFVAYESTDLRHWKYDGPLFDPATTAPTNWQQTCNSATLSCYRPHVLYDFASGYYRLWVNSYDHGPDGVQHGYHVLKSLSPVGPFVEDTDSSGHPRLPKLGYNMGGDFDLFQDANRAGYIVYAVTFGDPLGTRFNYKLVVEALSADYTTGTGAFTTLDTKSTEAPSMFRRGSDYYVTMSDPKCAYCNGTGTAYLRAKSPLGPWQGVGANVSLTLKQMYVDSRMALFTGADQSTQSRLAGLRDYDVSFRARPLPNGSGSARVGWMFRAKDTGNGYLWILSNAPYKGAPARLSREWVKNGNIVGVTSTGVSSPLSSTSMSLIRTRVIGTMVKTWLNGKLIDRTTVNKWSDRNFHAGYVGVRQSAGYSSYFDDFTLNRPAPIGYQLYLSENFNTASLASFPALNTYRRHGVKISDTSCSGQPDDVAMLRAPNAAGWEYLYQSDRWDSGDPNEAQATQYWEPMKFNADGSIQALLCGPMHTVVLSDASAPGAAPVGQPLVGTDGFTEAQDITSGHSRGQSFQVTKTSNLTQVALTLFQTDDANTDAPNADLIVSLYDVGGSNGVPNGAPIVQATVAQANVKWSPQTITVPLAAPLSPNTDGSPRQYALVLSTTSTTGAYGTVRSDGTYDADPTGGGLVTAADGTSWTLEDANDLRYALTVDTTTTP